MAIRLVELIIPLDNKNRVQEVLKDYALLGQKNDTKCNFFMGVSTISACGCNLFVRKGLVEDDG